MWKKLIGKFKKTSESVYLAVTLDGPIAGISTEQPRKPWIKVDGMSIKEAARHIPRIDWHTVPMSIRAKLELGDQCLTVTRDEAEKFLEAR